MLILIVPVDLDELLENCCSATRASDGESRRIVEMTEDPPVMLVIAILRSEDSWTNGAGEMFDVELAAECCDV